LKAIGYDEASKIAAIGEAPAQAYSKQQAAIGEEAIKQIKIVELIAATIENGKIKIVPGVLVTGGGNAGDGLMGIFTKLLPGVDIQAEEAGRCVGVEDLIMLLLFRSIG
jgi:hypothetical protein